MTVRTLTEAAQNEQNYIFLHYNFNFIKNNVAALAVMQCDAQEREPETCEPTPGRSWL